MPFYRKIDFRLIFHRFLAILKDRFWNTESLSSVLGEVDAVTVAQALFVLADKIHI